jgi:hypothetical protein
LPSLSGTDIKKKNKNKKRKPYLVARIATRATREPVEPGENRGLRYNQFILS